MNDNQGEPSSRLVKALKAATPASRAKPKRSTRAARKTTMSISDFTVSGDGNVIANHVTLNSAPKPPRPKIVPGDAHITQAQAHLLKGLVDEIVEIGAAVKVNKPTYAKVYGALYAKMKVPSYQLIARERFAEARDFLVTFRGRLLSMRSAPTRLGGDFRAAAIRFIHARCREFAAGTARREAYMQKAFGTTSISSLSDQELAKLRQHILGWRQQET